MLKKLSLILMCVSFTQNLMASKQCQYSVSNPKLKWTGYKFNEKMGVSGTFDKIDFKQPEHAKSVTELLKALTFEVDSTSINSDLPARDKKLVLFLFGALHDPGVIRGHIIQVDEKKKQVKAVLVLNKVTKEVVFDWHAENNKHSFISKIDLLDFKMGESVQKLDAACGALHTGKDGKTKTWSEVALEVSGDFNETCPQ